MKLASASIASLAAIACLWAGAVATAQGQGRDPVQVDPPTVEVGPQSSGFADDQGNPISVEELNRIREEETGLQWGNIAMAVAVLVLIAAAIVSFVRGRRSRRSQASY